MTKRPIGERVSVLETQLPEIDKRLAATIEGLGSLNKQLEGVGRQIENLTRFVQPVLWLAAAALVQMAGSPVIGYAAKALNLPLP